MENKRCSVLGIFVCVRTGSVCAHLCVQVESVCVRECACGQKVRAYLNVREDNIVCVCDKRNYEHTVKCSTHPLPNGNEL